MSELTQVQKRVLAALSRALDGGAAPTVRELADRLEMKRSTVHYHVQALRRAGYVTGEGRHRDLRLSDAARGSARVEDAIAEEGSVADATVDAAALVGGFTIPIVGSVAAGTPILAAENRDGELSLSGLFGRRGTLFALEVSGDSMIGDGINDGDFAVVRQQQTATPGEIVVAMIGDGSDYEATVKRYREERDAVLLEASNPAYAPLRFEGADRSRLQIVGKLVGVIRSV